MSGCQLINSFQELIHTMRATYALVFIHRKLQVTLPKILICLEYKKTVYVIVLERGALSISSTTIIMERI